ncbi:STAS domain-containing protein [Changchengzhania lutea]|uniref:STAS domain-containing protein n=1 Tax=Changchengzhania lutea TaxID=2049305 RepID=UPI00115D47B9|nr:STAS domain-containing protein [Changchengzhania lutea]
MALNIKHQDNIFFVEGTIDATTAKQFKNHLEFLILYTKALTININGVNAIDSNGMKALRGLNTTALISNKAFSIIGYGCKDIYDDFQLNNVA